MYKNFHVVAERRLINWNVYEKYGIPPEAGGTWC